MTHHLVANQSPTGPMIVSKDRIEREAREAAHKGESLNHACPYPFTSEAGRYFTRVYDAAQVAAAQARGEVLA